MSDCWDINWIKGEHRQIKSKAYGYLSLLDYACQLKTTGMLS